MKTIALTCGRGIVAAIVGLLLLRFYLQNKTAERIKITSPAGIATLEKIRLGGVDQWIQIRGEDGTKPILLFLHGGPGFPEMPFSHLNAALEKEFVVVHWDQRGAGKSYSSGIPASSMNIEQFVSDTHELVQLLLKRFGGSKVFLVGHSWGTIIGALTVVKYPELFHAYVGMSQAANPPESEKMMYRFALVTAQKKGNEKAVAQLKRIDLPPYKSFSDYRTMNYWVHSFSEANFADIGPWRFVRLGFASPAYSWIDIVRLWRGDRFSFTRLWREAFYRINLFEQAPRLDVSVYFFEGRHDYTVTVSAEMAEHYFRALDAPKGKELIWFEKSDHWPHLQEPEKYRAKLIEIMKSIKGENKS